MTEPDTIEVMIHKELMEILGLGDHDEPVTSETSLVTSGLLDSLGVVRMALFLEKEYGVDFAETFFDQMQFDSVRSMRNLVSELGEPGQ